MGLAGAKRRTKISADPNNTHWSRNSSSFGHRILAQQGWTPGSYLGAVDAAHASHYTAANASHVRVLLKDDNLGLGASRKREGAETFGLDQYAGLLGRLNGKDSAVLKKESDNRRDIQLRLYQEGKFGGVRFVSAGFLVGDEVKELKRSELMRQNEAKQMLEVSQPASDSDDRVKKGQKRGADGSVKEQITQNPVEADETPDEDDEKATKQQRKEARRQKRAERSQRREQRAAEKALKSERRQRKAERRKQLDKEGKADTSQTSSDATQKTSESNPSSGIDSSSGSPAPSLLARNSVRQRYIRQKRMAGMDPKALQEIFMIKSSA